jgi:PAS domain S-box-containing protein
MCYGMVLSIWGVVCDYYNKGIWMKFYVDKFKVVRQDRRYTIEKLSKEIGVTRATIWNWENGRRNPNETMVRKLATVLDVKTNEFSDIVPENQLSKELLQKPIQSFLMNAGSGESLRRKKFSELVGIVNYFNSSLEQSSIVIKAILDSMYSMCYIKDNSLQYIAANKSFLSNLGVNEDFVICGKKDDAFFTKSEASKNTTLDRGVLQTGEPIISQECFIPNSKKKRIGLITKQAIYDQNSNILGVVCIIVDITSRREEEERRIMLENIIDDINTGICFYNPQKNKVVYKNKSHKANFLSSIFYKHINSHSVHPDDFKRFQKYLAARVFPPSFDFRLLLPKEEMKWLKINHSRVQYRGEDYFAFFEENVTEIKKSEDINSIVCESLNDIKLAFCIVDIESKKLVYTNNYREEVYGYPVSVFLGEDNKFWLDNCVHPDDRERLINYEEKFEWPEKRQFRIVRPDGVIRWVEARNVKKIFSYNGRDCLAFFDRDITEERENKKLNELYTVSLDMVSDGVLIYEKVHGECVFANKAIIEKTGYCQRDFTKKKCIFSKNRILGGFEKDEFDIKRIMTRYGEELSVEVTILDKTINGRTYTLKTIKFL